MNSYNVEGIAQFIKEKSRRKDGFFKYMAITTGNVHNESQCLEVLLSGDEIAVYR